MDIEKLIAGLSKEAYGSDVEELLLEAATALEQLQAENNRLKEKIQQMRWIPVEEKLPEKENAQVFMTDGESCFISSRNNMMCFLGCEGFFIPGKAANITHWMPPPDPPARRPPDGEKEKIFNE